MITLKIAAHVGGMENIPSFMMVEKSGKDTVAGVILRAYEKYNIPRTIFNKRLNKSIAPLTGLVVIRNDQVVGMVYDGGYQPLPGIDQSVKDGDRIIFLLRAAGGSQF